MKHEAITAPATHVAIDRTGIEGMLDALAAMEAMRGALHGAIQPILFDYVARHPG